MLSGNLFSRIYMHQQPEMIFLIIENAFFFELRQFI